MGSPDDDLGTGVGHTDFTSRVSLLGQLASEELSKLGLENTVGHELLSEGYQKER